MDDIELTKRFNKIKRRAEEQSKLDYCLICKRKVTSFCNSHSLPRFILKSIEDNGFVYNTNVYLNIPVWDEEIGLNKAGTFKRICNECDNTKFQEYENKDNLLKYPTKKLLAEIDLKNSLKFYDKRLLEIKLFRLMYGLTKNKDNYSIIDQKQEINNLDLKEIDNSLNRALNILNSISKDSYNVIYYKVLDYVTPIAFQGQISLYGDLHNNIINDIYDYNSNIVIEYINICIFPIEGKTTVLMFVNKENHKYDNFIEQFNKLNNNDKLKLISFIIYNYSEDLFISKHAKEHIKNNEIIVDTSKNRVDYLTYSKYMSDLIKEGKKRELANFKLFPNILSKDNRIITDTICQ